MPRCHHDADLAASTATEHLARLERGGLVVATIAPSMPPTGLKAWRHGEDLRAARSCYDHLAGAAGVALVDRRPLEAGGGGFALTAADAEELAEFGLDVGAVLGGAPRQRARMPGLVRAPPAPRRRARRGAARGAPAPALGAAPPGRPRALGVTAAGSDGLASAFGVSLATIGTNFTRR